MALKAATTPDDPSSDSPAARAGAGYVALLWDLPQGLSFDKPETDTGSWDYPPAAKFDRLLRHCRTPVGLLTNRRAVRLFYAPHGESTGTITFKIDDMATVGGRPILDAFIMLLSATRFFGVAEEQQLPSLLEASRKRQANVTNELAEQVFDAFAILLDGFQAAAERDGWRHLNDAVEREDDHLYGGLLTVLLRLVFLLYAEDRSLLPVDSEHNADNLSVLGLFDELQEDHGAYPDSMSRRFGAWSHLVSLFRAVFLGTKHGDQGMVEKGEREILRERHEPQRKLCEVDREAILVDAIEAPLRDKTPSMIDDVIVRARDDLELVLSRPGGDELVGEEAAGFDEKGAGSHGRVADGEPENLLGFGLRAEGLQERLERLPDDRGREASRGVVAAGAFAFGAGLKDEAAGFGARGVLHAEVA